MGQEGKGDNVEAEEKQYEVTIYYADGSEGARCTAYLTEDKLKAILSGQSKEFIRAKGWWQEEDDDRDFYLNPQCITEILVERELSKRESR